MGPYDNAPNNTIGMNQQWSNPSMPQQTWLPDRQMYSGAQQPNSYQMNFPQQYQQPPASYQNRQMAPFPSATRQEAPKITGLPGRIISSDSEIRPNEVSMDGNPSFFPKRDWSSIIVKVWDNNGILQTYEYKLEQQAFANSSQDFQNEVLNRLNKLEENLNRRNNKTFNNAPQRKEGTQNE